MRKAPVLAAMILGLLLSSPAIASCVGSPSFQTCTDATGNTYTINRLGNMTLMNGYNSQTGSQWSQTTQSLGNMTLHNGQTNGQPWNMTTQQLGGMTLHNGTNSAGRPFSYTCTQFGCQ